MYFSLIADAAAVPADDLAKMISDLIGDLGTKSYVAAAVVAVGLVLALLKKFGVLGSKPAEAAPVPPPAPNVSQALKLLGAPTKPEDHQTPPHQEG